MKGVLCILFTILFPAGAFSQKAELLVLDEDIDPAPLERSFNVQRPSPLPASSLPDKASRDQLLLGIKEVEGWGEFEKDLLFMDLKKKPLPELSKKYPQLGNSLLKRLKAELK